MGYTQGVIILKNFFEGQDTGQYYCRFINYCYNSPGLAVIKLMTYSIKKEKSQL